MFSMRPAMHIERVPRVRRGAGGVSARRASAVLGAALACVGLGAAPAGAVALGPILNAPGATVTLDGGTNYTVSEHALSTSKTLLCNGAQISSTGGPIRVSGPGVQLVVDDCRITGTGWALVGALDGATLVVRNGTQLVGNGSNSAVYARSAGVDVDGGSIDDVRWGLNLENADAAVHGVTMTNVTFGVQNVAGSVTIDSGGSLTNPDAGNPGAGVSLIGSPSYPTRGATAVIHDTTFTGFGNAVDIQPTAAAGLPSGTAEIVGCTFHDAVWSAVAAVDATGVRIAKSRVLDAKTDGIYFVNSTVVVEDTEVLGSLNTGVTFYGCPNGGTIRDSLVRGSVHQGVAVVVDPRTGEESHGIRIVDTTLQDNVIANVLVDDRSDATIVGGTFSGAPDMSVRFQGTPAATMIATLLRDSVGGLEAKDGADVRVGLSVLTGHQRYAALAYANATAAFSHTAFDANGLDTRTADYAVVADTGADVGIAHCAFGPAASRAAYNNAGNAMTATQTYWADPSGPSGVPGGGTGAQAGATASNGSTIAIDPVRAASPVDVEIHDAFALDPGVTTAWTSNVGVTLELDGKPGSAAVSAGRVAAMRVRDASTLTTPAPPVGTANDGVVVVWAEFDLISRSASGRLAIPIAGDGSAVTLSRLALDGAWTPVPTAWDAGAGAIVHAPADPRELQGVFAFGNGQGCATARACLAPLVGAALCAEPLAPKMQKAIDRRLRKALAKLGKAVAATKATKAARLVDQARKALAAIETLATKFTQASKGPISPACRDAIVSALAPGRQRLEAGAI